MLYRYSAVNRGGSMVTGEMEAVSRTIVLDDLHKMGHLPVEVTESTRAQSAAANGSSGCLKASQPRGRSRFSRASWPCC